MSFGEAIKSYFKNYAVFKGRSRRSAFWFTVLFTGLVSIALGIINPADADENGFKNPSVLENLWSLATLVPSLAVSVRRLHDTGKSGANVFWIFLPVIGWIILLVAFVKDSAPGANQYGEPVK
ncbi:MAG: inner membrane protein yhaI [Actinomycetota bacterium]|jgi:uncharacterized membrane protein YhaH (DUF805 family)